MGNIEKEVERNKKQGAEIRAELRALQPKPKPAP